MSVSKRNKRLVLPVLLFPISTIFSRVVAVVSEGYAVEEVWFDVYCSSQPPADIIEWKLCSDC